jgi:PAS domain S-box-containing protein
VCYNIENWVLELLDESFWSQDFFYWLKTLKEDSMAPGYLQIIWLYGCESGQTRSLMEALSAAGWEVRLAHSVEELEALPGAQESVDALLLQPSRENEAAEIEAALRFLERHPAGLVVQAEQLSIESAGRLQCRPDVGFISTRADPAQALGALASVLERTRARYPLPDLALPGMERLIEDSQDQVYYVDRRLRLGLANPAFQRAQQALLGRRLEVGEPVLAPELQREYCERWKKSFQRALKGESFTTFSRVHLAEGEMVTDSMLNPVWDDQGQVQGILVIGRDITGQVHIQEAMQGARHELELSVQEQHNQLEAAHLALVTSEGEKRSILNSLSAQIALLDEQGTITAVNQSWLEFAARNGGSPEGTGVGVSYLDVCDQAAREGDALAAQTAWGIHQVMAGKQPSFQLEYPCDSPDEKRWFLLQVEPFSGRRGGVVISHSSITQMKQAQEDLERFFNLVPDMVCVATSDGYLKQLNREWERCLGYSREELMARPFMDRIHPDDRAATLREIERGVQGKAAIHFVNRYLAKDGDYRWLEWNAVPSPDGVTLYAAAQDISERKRAEMELREAERNYRLLAENSPDLIFTLHLPDYQVEFINRESIFGYSRQEVAASGSLMGNVHPHDVEELQAHWQKALRGERQEPVEYRLQLKDGSWAWISSRETVMERDESGSAKLLLVTASLVTERKQAEEALRRSEMVLNSFFDGIPQMLGIFRVLPESSDLEFLRINPAGLRALHISAEAVPRLRLSQLGVVEGTRRLWLEECLLCQESRQPVHFEYQSDALNGQWMLASLNLIEPGIFSFAAADISELKLMQRELQQSTVVLEKRVALRTEELSQANQNLARAVRLRDELLNNLSHELRTPLVGILGFSEALLGKTYGELSARQERAVSRIQVSGRHMQALVENLLEMAALLAEKAVLQPGKVDARWLVQASLDRVRQEAERKGISLHSRVDERVDLLRADEKRLLRILNGLLDNAVKFTAQGGSVGLDLEAEVDDRRLRWVVWDTGIGIAPEQQGQLFELFAQLDGGLARQYGGTGMGLAMVNQLVKLHGGYIEVESTPGVGSRFTVVLPWEVE